MRRKPGDWQLVGRRVGAFWRELTTAGGTEKGVTDRPWSVELEHAHREWQAAETYFQAVTDPELVDHAVFLLQACERKYAYLLGEKRRPGVSGLEM